MSMSVVYATVNGRLVCLPPGVQPTSSRSPQNCSPKALNAILLLAGSVLLMIRAL